MRVRLLLICTAILAAVAPALADGLGRNMHETSYAGSCRFVEQAAYNNQVSVEVLTRLIWTESRFQADALSPAGAQGISQFMPATATERGLSDPFDPRLAIPEAARFLADLDRMFGNIGLAVAAYNAGPGRISKWLASSATLPRETAAFVLAVTGRRAEEWVGSGPERPSMAGAQHSCMTLKASLREFGSGHGIAFSVPASGALRGNPYILPILKNSGLMQPGIEQSGQMLPSLRGSGQILPGLRQSGRMLGAMMDSGGALQNSIGKQDARNRNRLQLSGRSERNDSGRSVLYRASTCGACFASR